jgi:nucleotide-binding universal stress UspA family protein
MIKSILVCLEGSASTATTTLTAIEIAHELNASLSGIAIVDEPDIQAGALGGIGGSSFKHERDVALLADARTRADAWLAAFKDRCTTAKVQARALEVVGRPSEIILAEMGRHDLTLIGRDANFRFETNREDRVTREKILRHAAHPILLVPERAEQSSFMLGSTVLVAYDGGEAAQRALASFAASGLAESRTIHVATVGDDGARAWEMANLAVESLRASGIQATGHSIVSTLSNAEALAKFGQTLGAGMVVMGAFARSRMAELFGGSATRALAEHSQTPLYLQH